MKRFIFFFTSFFLIFSLFAGSQKNHNNEDSFTNVEKTVKVGYLITGENFMSGASHEEDKDGYAYEYLRTVASYTGWKYEYVYGYFSDLCKMLENGELDIVPDITYTEERSKVMNFPDHEMGVETYYLYSIKDKKDFSSIKDFSFFKDKIVGINKNTYQLGLFYEWKKKNKVDCIVHEYEFSDEAGKLLENGIIDFYLEVDYVAASEWNPVAKIGSSNFYLALNKNRSDLLDELNEALTELYTVNPYYNYSLWNKYYITSKDYFHLKERELKWIKDHNYTIKIGLLNDDLPFAFVEKNECKGAIVDLINYLKDSLNIENLKIEYKFYNDCFKINDALVSGQIDIGYPFIFDNYISETYGTILSNPIANVPMACVIRKDNYVGLKNNVAVQQSERSAYYSTVFFPNLKQNYYQNDNDVLLSVINGESDGAILNLYKVQNYVYGRKKYEMLQIDSLSNSLEICFAFNPKNFVLCNVINRVFSTIDESYVSNSIEKYSVRTLKYTPKELFDDYFVYVFIVLTFFSLLALSLFFTFEKLLKASSYDELTKLISRKKIPYYFNKIQAEIQKSENKKENNKDIEIIDSENNDIESKKESNYSLLLFDIDEFSHINDFYGLEFGDVVIQKVAGAIKKIINEKDLVFRSGGEEFLAIVKLNYKDALEIAEKCRCFIESQVIQHNTTKIRVTISVSVTDYQENLSFDDLFYNLQKALANAKNSGKNKVQECLILK